jgi:tRNA threonylcarbamoyladenosine biosynthesis protein TsaE
MSEIPASGGNVFSLGEEETFQLGRTLGASLRTAEMVLLEGPLGIGKTVFARGIAAGLGISTDQVCSPSYTLIQEYGGGRLPMYHVDLYRIEAADEITTLGFDELLQSGGIVVVEWGERLPASYRRDALTVRFDDVGEASRRIELLPSRGAGTAADH